MNFIASTISQDGVLTVMVDSTPYTVSPSHINYTKLIQAFKDDNADEFVKLMDARESINVAYAKAGIELRDEQVYYNGQVIHNSVCDRILDMVRQGFDVQPLINFLNKLMQNPSSNSVDQLFNFLSHKGLPITEDGDFLAYKTVRSDYLDKYSGTINNRPGTIVDWRDKRNQISDNPSLHCSKGLHVGALSYAGPGGWYNSCTDKVVIVKVNPADAVSVPNDHNFTKLRVCRYEVIADYVAPLTKAVYNTNESSDDWDYDEEDELDIVDDLFDVAIDVDEMEYGDHVEFDYAGERRYVEFDSYNDGCITGRLLKGDPSFKSGETTYRRFSVDKMSGMQLIYC